MNYFSRIIKCTKLLFHSFSFQYDPPMSQCNPPQSLLSAIVECSQRGKLLILHLTINKKAIETPINLPEDDFLIYTAPFNSRVAFDISRGFAIDSLPFAGLFFCPSGSPSDVQLIDKIVDLEDVARARQHFRRYQNEMYDRRANYIAHESNRNIINDQDSEFLEAERLARQQEEEERRLQELERQKEERIRQKERELEEKLKNLPPEPSPDDPDKVTIKFVLPNGEHKVRKFSRSNSLTVMHDFVAPIGGPVKKPIISYGFPIRSVSQDMNNRTFKDEVDFHKSETVYVEFDDYDDEI